MDLRRLGDAHKAKVATYGQGVVEMQVKVRVCPHCFAKHYPMWLIPGAGFRARWLSVRMSETDIFFVSADYGVEVRLLQWIERLWVADGTKFENFCKAYMGFWGLPHREHFRTDVLHAYVGWSSLLWAEAEIRRTDPEWLDLR